MVALQGRTTEKTLIRGCGARLTGNIGRRSRGQRSIAFPRMSFSDSGESVKQRRLTRQLSTGNAEPRFASLAARTRKRKTGRPVSTRRSVVVCLAGIAQDGFVLIDHGHFRLNVGCGWSSPRSIASGAEGSTATGGGELRGSRRSRRGGRRTGVDDREIGKSHPNTTASTKRWAEHPRKRAGKRQPRWPEQRAQGG